MANTAIKRGGVMYFLTEQACCVKQAKGVFTDDYRACWDAVEYLACDDADALDEFDKRINAVNHDLTGLEDYDTENYEGKESDVREAIAELIRLANDPDTSDDRRRVRVILKAADIIAGFYGVDSGIIMAG